MRLKTSVESYVTEFSHKDEVISVANSRNLLFVEELRAKSDDENWEEKFKTHKDSRPRGPESVSMDVVFTNSRNLYGLPEHTDSFVLANTEEGEPYRLFNLDVFQFEIDERMALYGGIPFVASHSPDRSSAALWLNAAETWVDIKYVDPEASIASWFTSGKVPEAHTFWLSETGKIDLFLFPGPSIQEVNDQYTVLTGKYETIRTVCRKIEIWYFWRLRFSALSTVFGTIFQKTFCRNYGECIVHEISYPYYITYPYYIS